MKIEGEMVSFSQNERTYVGGIGGEGVLKNE